MSDSMNVDDILKEYSEENTPSADEDVEVEVKGKKYKASQIEEYEKGYLRQSDYTRKTQSLSEKEKQWEAERQEYNQLKNYVGALIQRDPNLINYAQQLLSGQQPQSAMNNSAYADDPYMKEIINTRQSTQQAINQLWQQQQELNARIHEQELEREINALQRKYPKMDVDKVLNTVATQPQMDMEELAKQSHEDMTHRVNAEIRAMAENRQNQKRAIVEGSGGRTTGLGKPAQAPKTRAELEKLVAERLKMVNNL